MFLGQEQSTKYLTELLVNNYFVWIGKLENRLFEPPYKLTVVPSYLAENY